MFKDGLKLLFWTFSQIIIVLVSYEFYLRYAMMNGGHGYESVFSAIHPIIKVIIVIELIISSLLIIGSGIKSHLNIKFQKKYRIRP